MATRMVDDVLVRNWGFVVLRGVAALLFGLLTFFNPALTLATLILVFGAYAMVDGLVTIVAAVANRRGQPHWVALLVGGLLSSALGVLTFLYPGVTALVLLYFIGFWAAVAGIVQIAAAIRLRKVISGEWALALAGVVSIVFSILLFLAPGTGALAMALWIAVYAVVFGILLIVLGLRLRSWSKQRQGERTLRPA
jgi:uncharacterized membrane protein HdeD (DUF308 family)